MPTVTPVPKPSNLDDLWLPTGAKAETVPRWTAANSNIAVLTSGTLFCTAVPLRAGTVITSARVSSGTQAAVTPTAQWCALVKVSDRSVLGKTTDLTSTAWAANANQTFTWAAPITVPETALYYLGLVVVAGTTPSLRGFASGSVVVNLAPVLAGQSTTGLTDPASLGATAAALTTSANLFYATLL